MNRYVVGAIHPWNRRIFDEHIATLPGEWTLIDGRRDLSLARLSEINPKFVFFLHWSWKIPGQILDRFTCINFHMTDLPYGRGGSPLQNLILRGHTQTKLTAFKMTDGMDEGPIYTKEDLSLHGTAQEIYQRASLLAAGMIRDFVDAPFEPTPQRGEVTVFTRRKPAESEIDEPPDAVALYDFIRMLDVEDYPRAFLRQGRFRYEFSKPSLAEGRFTARVEITDEASA